MSGGIQLVDPPIDDRPLQSDVYPIRSGILAGYVSIEGHRLIVKVDDVQRADFTAIGHPLDGQPNSAQFAINVAAIATHDSIISVYFADTDALLGGANPQQYKLSPSTGAIMDRPQIEDMIKRSEAEADVKFTALMRHMDVIAADLRGDMKGITSKLDGVLTSTATIRPTIVTTAIASVLAILFGLGAIVYAAASLSDAMFGRGLSGRDAIAAAAKEQADKSREAIDKAVEELRAARTGKTPAQ